MPVPLDPPRPAHGYEGDPLLVELVERHLADVRAEVEPELRELGALSAGPLFDQQLAERALEPRLVPVEPWGRRVDRIELTPLWRTAQALSATHGLVAVPYERRLGARARLQQLALLLAVEPSLDVWSCPLAMSDGAARAILDAGNRALADRAVARLTSRDPARAWTSGQWMTERAGGSDVSATETVARRDAQGWSLHGSKWFCSATTSEMALLLARPEDGAAGAKGLALFYLETRLADGSTNGLELVRLKEKLGTRKLPTAEVELRGARAEPVIGLQGGVRAIAPMLTVTRHWNAMTACAGMQRAISLARDFARRRVAFGAPLARKPLHADTLAGLESEREGALALVARSALLLGRAEGREATELEALLLRVVVPLAKLCTAKQAVAVASEALECFGGAGYVEDTGLPRLLRDAQVLPIWEGTTNVLALDVLRALAVPGTPDAIAAELARAARAVADPALRAPAEAAQRAAAHALSWHAAAGDRAEAGARRLALTLARALEAALLAEHAQWALDAEKGPRAAAAARRLARHGLDLVADADDRLDAADAELLAT